jgi:DNA-binding XRE family transcriptional regulator
MDDVECYKKANVSRQTWHKILNDENYKPNKKTAISFAIALELNLKETQKLLETAGFILSKSSKFDIIIMYCIVKGIYDVTEIDSILFQYDQETLGGKL